MIDGDMYLLENQRQARKTSKYERELAAYLEYRWPEWQWRNAFNHPEGQKKFHPYSVDAYAELNGTVVEFLGCIVHGHHMENVPCPIAGNQSVGGLNPFNILYRHVYNQWRRKLTFLMGQPDVSSVVPIWECEYLRWRDDAAADVYDPRLAAFVTQLYEIGGLPKERLALRDALRGGRTEGFRLWWDKKAEPDRTLFYIDKNSLYPTMAIDHEYPVGEPECLIGKRLDAVRWCPGRGFLLGERSLIGLIQCVVMPPHSCFLPMLPARVKGKLIFGLCTRCMSEGRQSRCEHSEKERQITDTWTTAEVNYALEHGNYRLVKIHEMIVFPRQRAIFKKFFTRLAKMKLASEGFPAHVVTERAQQEYVKQLNDRMDSLDLSISDMKRNPARRQFAKEVANIGLGKFSQNDDRANITYVANWMELSRIYQREDWDFIDAVPITPTLAEVKYRPRQQKIGFHRNVHVVVYSFVTAYARIAMMKDMLMLQDWGARIFYTDTDSIIFDAPAAPLETWTRRLKETFLLGWTVHGAYKNEVDQEIISYACLGPKNYTLKLKDGTEIVKVRGFSLRHDEASRALNHDSMRQLIVRWLRERKVEIVTTSAFSMKIKRRPAKVYNSVLQKRYRNDGFDKRVILSDDLNFTTFPLCARFWPPPT